MSGSATRAAAVLLAAGSGTRVGAGRNKVLLPLDGVAVLARSVRTVLEVPGLHRVVLVVRPEDRAEVAEAVTPYLGEHDLWVVDGGAQRHDSEWQALRVLADEIESGELDVVAIHDAARPLAGAALWQTVIATAAERGGAIPVVRIPQMLESGGSLAPSELVAVQTPQAFHARELLRAYRQADVDGFVGSDTAACLERYTDVEIVGVPSSATNLKVTFREDVTLAATLLRQRDR